MKILSLGAGVQSSAMLLMGIDGVFGDKPDCAIFADTQGETDRVNVWLEILRNAVAPFPIHVATGGNLGEDYLNHRRRAAIPAFSTTQDGKPTMMSRFCSKSYKVEVIYRKARELVGPRGSVESWIGISTDEAHRMKPTGKKWISNRFPLIEAGFNRTDCVDYVVERLGMRPPKSSCFFCPYHSDAYWIDLKKNHPEDFARAVEFDVAIRNLDGDKWDRPRFLHRSMLPLSQVKFLHEDQGAMFADAFGNECEGVCGL